MSELLRAMEDEQPDLPDIARMIGYSPSLAVSLEMWGQVVAHRAACKAAPKWCLSGTKKKPLVRTRQNHSGLSLRPWEMAKNYHRYIEGETALPASPRLSIWVRTLLGAGDGPAGRTGRKSDVKAVELSFLTIEELMRGRVPLRDNRYWQAPRRVQVAIAWMFAAPWFMRDESERSGLAGEADEEAMALQRFSTATWCAHWYGQDYHGDQVALIEREIQAWAVKASHRMRTMPQAQEAHERMRL